MSEKRTSLEVIAPTIEEAIEKGLDELGLPDEAVEVEVLDAGSKGLFGLGSRQARVRLTIKTGEEIIPAAEPEVFEEFEVDDEDVAVEVVSAEAAAPEAELPQDSEATLRVAQDTISELLGKMKVRAQVRAHLGEKDDLHGKAPVMVDITGNDLSILIGPKAETLNALQYIAGLIISKELGRSVPLVVDVQGFRSRREQQIRQLARRMAEQAVKTGKRQVLEPMPASERRLIHVELRSNSQVSTESIGEEPRRKVTIVPKP